MTTKAPKTPLEQRKLDAETRASQWLADGNDARESGNLVRAEKCYAKAQFWLDRSNLLNNRAATAAPVR